MYRNLLAWYLNFTCYKFNSILYKVPIYSKLCTFKKSFHRVKLHTNPFQTLVGVLWILPPSLLILMKGWMQWFFCIFISTFSTLGPRRSLLWTRDWSHGWDTRLNLEEMLPSSWAGWSANMETYSQWVGWINTLLKMDGWMDVSHTWTLSHRCAPLDATWRCSWIHTPMTQSSTTRTLWTSTATPRCWWRGSSNCSFQTTSQPKKKQ